MYIHAFFKSLSMKSKIYQRFRKSIYIHVYPYVWILALDKHCYLSGNLPPIFHFSIFREERERGIFGLTRLGSLTSLQARASCQFARPGLGLDSAWPRLGLGLAWPNLARPRPGRRPALSPRKRERSFSGLREASCSLPEDVSNCMSHNQRRKRPPFVLVL